MFLELKISYSFTGISLVLVIFKLTCLRKMSLLITLVIMSANFETIALIYLSYNIFFIIEDKEEKYEEVQRVFQFAPVVFLTIILMLNICVSTRYLRAIKKPISLSKK